MKIRLLSVFLLIALLATIGTASAAGSSKRVFFARLSGDDAGIETDARGFAVFILNREGTELQYRLLVRKIENVTMAHIHLAPPGENGPPVAWLYPEGPPPQEIAGRFDGRLAKGVITSDSLVGPLAGLTLADLVSEMHAGNTYVNVHTTQNPPGEIRDQIH